MLNYLNNYLKKFAMDILPSVAATIIGAYIVNHYIVTKPGADAPVAAAVSTADPKIEAKSGPKAEAKGAPGAAKPAEASSDLANVPEVGGKARGASEKAVLEKPAEKSDKPAETASIPVETRR